MNATRRLFLAAAPLALLGLAACQSDNKKVEAKYAPDSCCAKAAAEGKACAHPCCADAAKAGKVCEKCNKL